MTYPGKKPAMSDAAAVATARGGDGFDRSGAARIRRRREILVAYLLLAPALVLVLGLQAFPVAWQVWFSLTNFSVRHAQPIFVGLHNYLEFLRDPGFWLTTGDTVGYIVLTQPGRPGGGAGVRGLRGRVRPRADRRDDRGRLARSLAARVTRCG